MFMKSTPGVNALKFFFTNAVTNTQSVFVSGKFIQASLTFVSKALAYPNGAPLRVLYWPYPHMWLA